MRRLQVRIKMRLGRPLLRNPHHAGISHICCNTIPLAAVFLPRCSHYRLGRFCISGRTLSTELNPDHYSDCAHINPQIIRPARRSSTGFATILLSRQPRFRQRKSQACLLFYSALPNLVQHRRTRIITTLIEIERGIIAALSGTTPISQGREHCRQTCHSESHPGLRL